MEDGKRRDLRNEVFDKARRCLTMRHLLPYFMSHPEFLGSFFSIEKVLTLELSLYESGKESQELGDSHPKDD